ncbi:MAG: hypothetical protein V4549_03530 [Bacteroidota bacterium]
MAQDDKEKFLAEEKATKEATEKYDDLVASLVLIATSNRTKAEKFILIDRWRVKMQKFNNEFSIRHTENVYNEFQNKALQEAQALEKTLADLKKNLSTLQTQEMQGLSEQLNGLLNQRLDTLVNKAKELTIKEELTKFREKKLGMKNAEDRIQLTPKKSEPNLVFTNTKGQIVSLEAVMKLTIGDQLWSTVTAAQRSEWLLLGFKFVLHISVLDEHTTQICRSLNKTLRDLTKDQLPPMHRYCRSKIKLVKDGWNLETFLKNFPKKF